MHFQSKLHSNSIITGSVDCYCLACDSYLRSEDEAFTHTEKPIHQKNMAGATRLEKFLDDQIVKVKKGYYCTFCNTLLSTMTKVAIHISDMSHQENKGAQMLTRIGDNVVAFDEVAISWQAWHGMIENTCVVCNTEFDKEQMHRIDQSHVLKLIQSKCEFGDKYIYRKVDEESFFCLICGGVFAISDKPDHHENTKHNSFYIHGKELKKTLQMRPQSKSKKTKTAHQKPKTDIGTKDNVTDHGKTHVAESNKNSNAAGAKKKEPLAAKSSQAVDSKETEKVGLTGVVDDKNIEVAAIKTEPVKSQNTEKADTGPAKIGVQETLGSAENAVPKHDFIDSVSKEISANKDHNMSKYLDASYYVIEDGSGMKCVLCDVMGIRKEDVEIHLSKDLHHQMMLKKQMETLNKKRNDSNTKGNEEFSVDNSGEKINLDNPENRANYVATIPLSINTKQPQLNLEIASPLDIQSKISKQNSYSDLTSDEEECKTKILKKVDKFQQNNITIDMSAEKAHCKQCNEDVPFDAAALERHINEQHVPENISFFIKPEIDSKVQLATFAQENHMMFIKNEIYCKLCKVTLPTNMESMIQHANTDTHEQKAICKHEKGPLKKMHSSDFVQTFFRVESNLGADVILNNKYVLKPYSFHCVVFDEIYKCAICEIDFSEEIGEELAQHINTTEHKMKMGMSDVVVSLPEEFVREITPGRYHCGYCNKVTDRWPEMQDHLLHQSHLHARRHARWNLERCYTAIRNSRTSQVSSMEAINFA